MDLLVRASSHGGSRRETLIDSSETAQDSARQLTARSTVRAMFESGCACGLSAETTAETKSVVSAAETTALRPLRPLRPFETKRGG